jgi:hypothetical protein
MDLKSLMIETRAVDVEFEALPGFTVTLGYLSKSLLRRLSKEATVSKMDQLGNVSPEFDSDKFLEAFCSHAVSGWKGLTYEKLAQLMLIDETSIEDMSKEVEYSKDNAFLLMKESQAFDNWVNDRVNQLSIFRKS